MLERKEEKQIKKTVKKNNEVDFKVLGGILTKEFIGELSDDEVAFLKKINSDLNLKEERIKEKFLQKKFVEVRNYLIETLFSNSIDRNKMLKQELFEELPVPKQNSYKVFEEGNMLLPFIEKYSSVEIKRLKRSKVYTKTGIKNELNRIYDAKKKEYGIYYNMRQKAFFDSLTEEEKEFAGVSNQKEYDFYFKFVPPIGGSYECYNDSIIKEIDKIRSHFSYTFGRASFSEELYFNSEYAKKRKLSILDSLKENGMITNDNQELYFKKALDKLIITYMNYDEIKQEFLGDVSSHKK